MEHISRTGGIHRFYRIGWENSEFTLYHCQTALCPQGAYNHLRPPSGHFQQGLAVVLLPGHPEGIFGIHDQYVRHRGQGDIFLVVLLHGTAVQRNRHPRRLSNLCRSQGIFVAGAVQMEDPGLLNHLRQFPFPLDRGKVVRIGEFSPG